ncbi:MAG: hypothetical protein Q9209_006661 [Squamulea sp. 1 TL-2023]
MAQQPSLNGADAERDTRLRQIQMEALGTSRRDFLTTHDVAGQFLDRLSTSNVELHRRVNQRGTHESKVTDTHRDSLAGWNCMSKASDPNPLRLTARTAAWQNLQNDDALEQGLEDLNAGQSHRARLLTVVPQLQDEAFTVKEVQRRGRGGFHPRGTGRGGRGGSVVGSQPIRTARRRVPIGNENDLLTRRVIASKTPIPSLAKGSKPLALQVKLPQALLKSAASDKSRVRIRCVDDFLMLRLHSLKLASPGNFTLAPPEQFMSHVSTPAEITSPTASVTKALEKHSSIQLAQALGTTTKVPASNKVLTLGISQSVQVPTIVAEPQAFGKVPQPGIPSQAVQERAPVTLSHVEANPANKERVSSPLRSYADDLLGMETEESNVPLNPLQISTKAYEDRSKFLPSSEQPSLELLSSQLAAFLPVLKDVLPAEMVEKLESVSKDLQYQVRVPTRGSAPQTEGNQQQSSKPSSKPPYRARGEAGLPIRGLANAVQQRTLAWGKDIIAGTKPSSSSILGENVSRHRFSRRRVSVDSLASVVSIGSSTALTERIDQLQLDESRPPPASRTTDTSDKYSTTNPFGPKPASRVSVSGTTLTSVHAAERSQSSVVRRGSGVSTAGPQLPAFLRSQVRAEDPAAAIRVEYAATFPCGTSQAPEKPADTLSSVTTMIPRGFPIIQDNTAPLRQRHPQESRHITDAVENRPSSLAGKVHTIRDVKGSILNIKQILPALVATENRATVLQALWELHGQAQDLAWKVHRLVPLMAQTWQDMVLRLVATLQDSTQETVTEACLLPLGPPPARPILRWEENNLELQQPLLYPVFWLMYSQQKTLVLRLLSSTHEDLVTRQIRHSNADANVDDRPIAE